MKKVFLEISLNSQENTCARVSFLIKLTLELVFSCEFCEISKNTFFYRTPLVAAFVGFNELYWLCYVYVNFKRINQSYWLQKLANQLMLNSALVIEMLHNSFSESKKNFGRLIKRGTFSSKERDMSSEKYILLDFTK